MNEAKRGITIISYPDEILIHPNDESVSGIWFGAAISISLKKGIDDDTFCKSIISMFDKSKINIPHPDPKDWSSLSKLFLTKIGKKSKRKYMENAKLIQIKQYSDRFEIVPTKNGGIKGDNRGFSPISKKTISVGTDRVDTSFIKYVYQALDSCI